jgi:hypothetical protein
MEYAFAEYCSLLIVPDLRARTRINLINAY